MNNQKKNQYLNEEVDRLQEEYATRKFSYDPAADAGYQEYARLVTEEGKKAMEDTVGKASALTGGYGNSYAATAGAQVYADHVKEAAAARHDFRARAREEFDAENADILNRLAMRKEQGALTTPTQAQIDYAKEKFKIGEAAADEYISSLQGVDTDAIYEAIAADDTTSRMSRFTVAKDGGRNFGGGLNNNAKYTLRNKDGTYTTMSAKKWVEELQKKESFGMTEQEALEFVMQLQNYYGVG